MPLTVTQFCMQDNTLLSFLFLKHGWGISMPIGKEQFLKQFTQQALDERISLFLGAGGSCDAGYPNWANLFLPVAKDLGTPIDESTDYYRLAQYYSNNFGSAELRKKINERINKNNYCDWGQGYGGDFPIRPCEGAHNIPSQNLIQW